MAGGFELRLTPQEYERFRARIAARFGLEFPPERRHDLLHRISEAFRRARCSDTALFLRALESPEHSEAVEHLAAVLTVGETCFYRNRTQFAALTGQVLPDLIARRRREGNLRLRLWSCGCSTGEEPYSLAIALHALLPDLSIWDLEILGTDLNGDALQQAREGRYGPWSFREMDPALRDRWFTLAGHRWELDPAIRSMVTYRPLNLAEPAYPVLDESMDLILCRNVTIYFAEPMTRHVIKRLYRALQPGAWLLVGASEPNNSTYRAFETETIDGAILYRRPRTGFEPASGSGPDAPPPQLAPQSTPEPGPDPVPGPPPGPVLPSLHALIDQVRQQADRGELAEAERLVRAVIERESVLAEAHYLLALVCQEQGRAEEAIQALRRSLFLDRGYVAAHLRLGLICRQTGREEQARRAWLNAAALLQEMPAGAPVAEYGEMTAGQLLGYLDSLTGGEGGLS